MLGLETEATWRAKVPAETESVLFVFAPTRSVIDHAEFVDDEAAGVSGVQDVIDHEFETGLGVSAIVPSKFDPRAHDLVVRTRSVGEPLRLAGVIPYDTVADKAQTEREVGSFNEQVYRRREIMAEAERRHGDPKQFLFFYLDGQSDVRMMRFAGLSPEEITRRRKEFEELGASLWTRVQDRHCGRDVTRCNVPMELASHILRRAVFEAYTYFPPAEVVGRAFGDFGCGWLRRLVNVRLSRPMVPVLCSEPNSANIFLFAELGFAAIENNVDPAFWGGLLPFLVRMQGYYIKRFRNPQNMCLGDFGIADTWLEVYDRREIDQEAHGSSGGDVEIEMKAHLDRTDPRCRHEICGADIPAGGD